MFELSVDVAPADIDELGHVSNVVYLRWVQDVAAAHWRVLAPAAAQSELVWVVVRHEIDYKAPAVLGDWVLLRTWVGGATALLFERHTEIRRAGDGQLLARGRTMWCPLDTRTHRPKRVSSELRALCSVAEAGDSPDSAIVWRRLDVPGHDSATVSSTAAGAAICGMAVFEQGGAMAVHYTVQCDAAWRTTAAHLHGWWQDRRFELRILRDDAGGWRMNDARCPAVADCLDLDLGFTPATNLLPLRRLDLGVGQSAEVRSAWLESPDASLKPLVQRYRRRSATDYEYESDVPGTGMFQAVLRVDRSGWVVNYGDLWRAETRPDFP